MNRRPPASLGSLVAKRRWLAGCALLLAALPIGLMAQTAPAVQLGVSVRPDTVTVGDPFSVIVRLKVPVTAKVVWPALTDSAATIAPRAPMVRRDGPSDVSGREELAEYQVAAWDTGQLATDWPDVLVVVGDDTIAVSLADARVYVQSVLSADTAQHVPRPAKPPFGRLVPWWQRWWPVLVVLALLALLAWVRWRRQRPAVAANRPLATIGPYERAMEAFDRVERLAFSDAGEPGRASLLAMEILRTYLAERVPTTSQAHTSAELIAAVAADARVPHEALLHVIVRTDAVKYARRAVTAADAQGISRQARGIVTELEDAERARAEPVSAGGDRLGPMDAPPPTMAGVG